MYDSKFEETTAPYLQRFSCIRCSDTLEAIFKDKQGVSFKAKADFYHPATGLFIELKCSELNSKTSKASADKAIARQLEWRNGNLKTIDELNFSWSNSIYKQSIVQKELTRNNFIIVFDVLPNFDEAQRLIKAGLVWCDLRSLPSYLGFLQLQRAGINAFTFRLSYTDNEIEHVLYPAT
ncbi:MAG: hypothetical protein Q7T66_04795 [Herminiimonas sp.]|uniref:hypothetical protein n=1 Tax=Herminiimonas sp. TaxID=1926289 RepID=UPI002716448D|nr:hypothetical protein [Herminiimonas sp.]MDO9419963.1 hypothetical protein [Herminiimonas sp.]